MEKQGFGVSLQKNKAAVRSLPIDFFGLEYFAPNMNLRQPSLEECQKGRKRRLEARRRLVGF